MRRNLEEPHTCHRVAIINTCIQHCIIKNVKFKVLINVCVTLLHVHIENNCKCVYGYMYRQF